MDLESHTGRVEYSRAKDEMLAHSDIKQAPWHAAGADRGKYARSPLSDQNYVPDYCR